MVSTQTWSNWIQEKMEVIKSETVTDHAVDEWFLMGSVWPVVGIIAAYLFFVLKIGPEIMKKRKPLEMKSFLLVYNLLQVYQNGRLFWLLLDPVIYATKDICSFPLRRNDNSFFLTSNVAAWYLFMSKISDLLDTIFFVLRKKQSQVTFLHVYHHATMVFHAWSGLKYIRGEHVAATGLLNSFVHIVMYSYYFLAALGPSVQKYLWWKKYITVLQLIQMVLITSFPFLYLLYQCKVPLSLSLYLSAHAFVFLLLFLKFYNKTYTRKGVTATDTKKKNK